MANRFIQEETGVPLSSANIRMITPATFQQRPPGSPSTFQQRPQGSPATFQQRPPGSPATFQQRPPGARPFLQPLGARSFQHPPGARPFLQHPPGVRAFQQQLPGARAFQQQPRGGPATFQQQPPGPLATFHQQPPRMQVTTNRRNVPSSSMTSGSLMQQSGGNQRMHLPPSAGGMASDGSASAGGMMYRPRIPASHRPSATLTSRNFVQQSLGNPRMPGSPLPTSTMTSAIFMHQQSGVNHQSIHSSPMTSGRVMYQQRMSSSDMRPGLSRIGLAGPRLGSPATGPAASSERPQGHHSALNPGSANEESYVISSGKESMEMCREEDIIADVFEFEMGFKNSWLWETVRRSIDKSGFRQMLVEHPGAINLFSVEMFNFAVVMADDFLERIQYKNGDGFSSDEVECAQSNFKKTLKDLEGGVDFETEMGDTKRLTLEDLSTFITAFPNLLCIESITIGYTVTWSEYFAAQTCSSTMTIPIGLEENGFKNVLYEKLSFPEDGFTTL